MKPSELLSDPKRWTQGSLARKAWGVCSSPNDPEAASWCALGAITKCFGEDTLEADWATLALGAVVNSKIVHWNDNPKTTHEEVLARLKEAGL